MATIYGTSYHDDGSLQVTSTFPFFAIFNKLQGTNLADVIYGFAGNDILIGYEGNDRLDGGSGNDELDGRSGNDTLIGGPGIDVMRGWSENDTYYVDDISDKVIELLDHGNETVYSTAAAFFLPENVENLILHGATALNGYGNDLRNSINGNENANNLFGYGGNDAISGGSGNDFLYGGSGHDGLSGDGGNDYLFGADGNDALNGGADNDTLFGDSGDDILMGLSGEDQLFGGNGNDNLLGYEGNDQLVGGGGKDILTGHAGSDRFIFNSINDSPAGASKDTISDFSWQQEDKIVFGRFDANLNVSGIQRVEYNQLSFDYDTNIFKVDIIGGSDIEIQLSGVLSFIPSLDVIIE